MRNVKEKQAKTKSAELLSTVRFKMIMSTGILLLIAD